MPVRILMLFVALSSSLAIAEEVQEQKTSLEATVPAEVSRWGVGLAVGAQTFGVQAMHEIAPTWAVQLHADTTIGSTCCMGDNPTAQVPYGYEINDFRRNRLFSMVIKSFPFGSSGKWSFFGGAGVGVSETKSRAQFYNKWLIGYDRNSPAGSDSITQNRVYFPAQLGIRKKFASAPFMMGAYIDFPLNGNAVAPEYTAPNGQIAKADSLRLVNEGSVNVDLNFLF